MVQSFKQFGANLTQTFGLWVFWNGTYLKIPIWLVIDDSYDIICDFFKVGLIQRTPNLLESISTQNPLFWVVPTVHTQRFRELCQKSSVEKMLCFLCCSRVVSDMAEVRFMWIFHEVGRSFISIVAVFFSLFSKTEDKTGVEPVQTSLSFVIRYSLYVSLITSAKTADTKHHVTLKQICMEAVKHKLTTSKHKHICNWQTLGCCTMPSLWVLLSFLAVPAYGIAFTSKAELRAAVVAWETNTERLPGELQNNLVRWFFCRHGLYD